MVVLSPFNGIGAQNHHPPTIFDPGHTCNSPTPSCLSSTEKEGTGGRWKKKARSRMPVANEDEAIVTKDGKAYCTVCKEFLPSDSPKGVKQHLKSKTHKACLQGGPPSDKKKKVDNDLSSLHLSLLSRETFSSSCFLFIHVICEHSSAHSLSLVPSFLWPHYEMARDWIVNATARVHQTLQAPMWLHCFCMCFVPDSTSLLFLTLFLLVCAEACRRG